MGNFQYYNYSDTEKDLTNLPAHTHLIIEKDSDTIYYSKNGDQTKLYKFVISTGIESQVDIDPSNSSGDNKSRDHNIKSLWYDGSFIWGVDCDDGGSDTFDVWKLQVSNDACTEIGTYTTAMAGTIYSPDIFKISTNTYVAFISEGNEVAVYDVDTAPFTEKDTVGIVDWGGDTLCFGVVVGTHYYSFVDYTGQINGIDYDDSIPSVTVGNDLDAYILSDDINQTSIALNTSEDEIYLIAQDWDGATTYLTKYNISGDSYTVLGEYNIALMLNRNVRGANPPFDQEKAFHISVDKIYQIPAIYTGVLNLISTFNFSDTIIAITDNYLIDASGNVYKYIDLLGSIYEGIIYHIRQDYPYFKMRFNSDNITITPQMLIQIIGSYTANGSTTATQVVFEGIAKTPTEGRIQFVLVENQGSEMDQIKPDGLKAGRSDEILSDINDDGAPSGPEYIRDGTLAVGSAMGNIQFNKTKTLRKTYNDFAEKDFFTWYLKPQGAFDYNSGGVDSGADIRYDGSGNLDPILQVKAWKVAKLNQIIVNGANNPGTGKPYSGIWNDIPDQQANNINSVTIEDANLNSDAKCQSKADTMGANETERTRARFKFRKTTYGLIQSGQTITFKYDITNYMTIAEAQFILDKMIMNIKTEMGYAEISSGL